MLSIVELRVGIRLQQNIKNVRIFFSHSKALQQDAIRRFQSRTPLKSGCPTSAFQLCVVQSHNLSRHCQALFKRTGDGNTGEIDRSLYYLDEVVLLSSAGVSSRLKDPRSALAGARAGLLLLFRVEDEEEERKLDSAHAPQRGKHWVIISQVSKT